MKIEMQKVDSSNLAKAGYDAETKTLRIEFRGSGQVWDYEDVSEKTFENLLAAPSIGKFFNQSVKDTYYGSRVSG
jgi:KTSC domain